VAIKAVDEASSVMGKIQSSLGLLGGALQNLGGGFSAVGTVIQGFAAGGIAGAAIGAFSEIAKGLRTSVEEAGKAQQVYQDLSIAVEKNGTAWDTVSEATKTALLHIQAITKYSDEEAAAALQKLMTFGIGYKDAMAALPAIIDFAAAKHMDLESAATLVGKAMDGNTAIMKRYGVDIATTKDQAAALATAQDAAAKAIKAMGDGVAGWVTNVTAAIGASSEFEQGLTTAKDKAGFLIEQFKQGAIDLPQFATAMTSLGVPLDEVALKGGSAEAVLSKLNEQFGGTAQEQANTYAGIQERLKNATSELGEKIGTMLLPGLAGITEAMIPLVDWFGKGVDAIQVWMTEVAKMPEVKAATDAVGEAWKGLMGWFDSAANSAQQILGPALNELWSALKDLYDALAPIFAAFKELWDAIAGSQGDFDAFKIILEAIKLDIEASVASIRLIIEVVKAFAQGFKEAADFIAPILVQITTAVTGFLTSMQDAFKGFYDWLVGGSLWQDMWNAIVTIAQNGIATLIGILTDNLIQPITTILTNLAAVVQAGWNTAWTGLSESFLGLTSSIESTVASVWDPLSAYLQGAFANWGTWADNALTSIRDAIVKGMGFLSDSLRDFMVAVYKTWNDFVGSLQHYMEVVVGAIIATVEGAAASVDKILGAMIDAARTAAGTISGILAGIASSIQGAMNQAGNLASAAGQTITNALTGAWNVVATAATNFYNWLVGHSLWPDLMDALVSQTEAGMSQMKAAFTQGLGAVMINAPTVPSASPSPTAPVASQVESVTLPVVVQIDGATVARTVERRLISRHNLSAWR
jgi:phage-related protein